ncbi:hypothetical protein D1007_10739 [Hordeum vulgare]|nr:hypothetical protein D1007_10739 [Hordeum vulgare]
MDVMDAKERLPKETKGKTKEKNQAWDEVQSMLNKEEVEEVDFLQPYLHILSPSLIELLSVFVGLVPPFSLFFIAILNHYGIQALHLQPNSILLLSVFAFYFEAFVGVRPSLALFRHFFSMCLHDDAHLSACVSFIAAQSGNLLLKVGKKVENFIHCRVLMSLKDANPRLEEPKGQPEKTSAWSVAKLSNPRAAPILERFSRDISAKRLTGGMIVKEFLAQRLLPLQAHSRPLWDY